MGMGAHRMNVPPEIVKQMAEQGYQIDRAELMICLPPDWKIEQAELSTTPSNEPEEDPNHPWHENWYWPLRWLKTVALVPPVQFGGDESQICKMPDGSEVVFWQMLPIYADEMNFKLENDNQADVLLAKFNEHPVFNNSERLLVLDINRQSVIANNPR